MLIFDNFPDSKHASDFAAHVRSRFGRKPLFCDSQKESDQHDPFPFKLVPPIVLVERDKPDGRKCESEIESAVADFGGRFAGT